MTARFDFWEIYNIKANLILGNETFDPLLAYTVRLHQTNYIDVSI